MEGIRMASLEDIAAMKIIAIANRGSKMDFFEDAEHGFDPETMTDLSWDKVKAIDRKAVEEVYLN